MNERGKGEGRKHATSKLGRKEGREEKEKKERETER